MNMEISLNTIVRVTENQLSCDLGDGIAILNTNNNCRHTLNLVGAKIWAQIQKPTRIKKIVTVLVAEFDTSRKACEEDTLRLINELIQSGIVKVVS